ncbi:MAG: undecaprenyl-diphosphate phosphatase [Armatimonadetes bacterium]|nr:undecaprenyl-diphosphate phosphatase [Armatimonadota bacterium]
MGNWQAVVLGVVQGVAEFLPISSSGHLVAVPTIMGWPEHSLQFDVSLHMGTLLALLVFFRRDWMALALALAGRGSGLPAEIQDRRRLAITLLAACVPAAVAGVVLERAAESTFRSPWLVASTLSVAGLVMLIADRRFAGTRSLKEATLADGMLIGVAQVLALVPGVSRSGATITAGLMCRLSRADAARFSFLLSVPITLGAGLYGLRDLVSGGMPPEAVAPFAAGMAASAVVGYVTIAFLLDYLRKHSLALFVYYRWAFALLLLIMAAVRG